jgi:hypothetical protein
MGEVGEDAILEVHSWGGVALAMPSLLIWFRFDLQGFLSPILAIILGAEYAGYILANPPFLYTSVIEVSRQLKTCTLKQH